MKLFGATKFPTKPSGRPATVAPKELLTVYEIGVIAVFFKYSCNF